MAQRRTLSDGLGDVEEIDRELEEQFVYGKQQPRRAARPPAKTEPEPETAVVEQPVVQQSLPPAPTVSAPAAAENSAPYPFLGAGRIAIGARVRTELAAILKRTSLERQLQGIEPYAVQDILEEALELWLHKQGLLK